MSSNDQERDELLEQEAARREELAFEYLDQLPYTPYDFQEKAILSWFESKQGTLVCAPTGMGKTLIAEAGLFEALKTGKKAYYTTPLIALTEQKFRELQEAVERWGFDRSNVGLITGNRRENVDAPILVVVAEILFNRLLSSDAFERFANANRNVPILTPVDDAPAAKPTISAASLNAKNSLAITQDEADNVKKSKGFVEDAPVEKPALPEVPIDMSDFDEDEDWQISNTHFSFDDVSVVVMDEFHQFADPERGVVWEFTLGLLPAHVRTLLISATVGNALEFVGWLRKTANRSLDLIQSSERKVPLVYQWIDDRFLSEQLVSMCAGTEEERYSPGLVFCFNRDECWSVANELRKEKLIDEERKKLILEELENHDMKKGIGPKLRELLLKGVGVHHAGVLPKYRRIVETLFQRKLLAYCVCTETLAAGINLPARSVILPTLLKGPAGNKKLIEPSSAHQIFGRAGRPQYDDCGYVFALCHEDDVKIARSRKEYDAIPEDTKDPHLREMKKKLKKKIKTRRPGIQYWSEKQFEQLQFAAAGRLASRGPLPWRLLAHMIESNSDVSPIRSLVTRRLTSDKIRAKNQVELEKMLLTLWRGGFVRLAPNPISYGIPGSAAATAALLERRRELKERERRAQPFAAGLFDDAILDEIDINESFDPDSYDEALSNLDAPKPTPEAILAEKYELPEGFDFSGGDDLFNLDFPAPKEENDAPKEEEQAEEEVVEEEPQDGRKPLFDPILRQLDQMEASLEPKPESKPAKTPVEKPKFDINALSDEVRGQLAAAYRVQRAYPTPKIKSLTSLRGVNPVYGTFLLEQLGIADRRERIQAFESLLEMPATVARDLRVPRYDELPPGPLATSRLDQELLQAGLATLDELVPRTEEEENALWERRRHVWSDRDERVFLIPFAEKLRRLFDYRYPGVSFRMTPIWCAGELIEVYKGDFNKFVVSKKLEYQEGVVFRHLLRLILLLEEFIPLKPLDCNAFDWRRDLEDFAEKLVACCREVDPSSVEETLSVSKKNDLLDKQ